MREKGEITRRKFVRDATAVAAGLPIVPRHVLGKGMTPPSDLLNIAGIGVGGMGRQNLINLASQNIGALCYVDCSYVETTFDRLTGEAERLQRRLDGPEPEALPGKPPFD